MAGLSDGGRRTAEAIIARYPAGRERSAVLPLLYLMQSEEGRLTQDGLRQVGKLLGIRTAEVEAVASFYSMLRMRPTGTHVVSVCTNLSCALRGANEVFAATRDAAGVEHEDETSPDGLFTVHEEECLGACDAAPVVQVDFANHDRVTPERVVELVEALRVGEVPTPSRGRAPKDFRDASRILAGGSGGSGSERVSASGSPPGAGGSGGS
ncbi:MAG TPA: NAD(P)H-dependent oxidoreductase subunit E [Actinomycetota bacterium]|nr:NAD(P)H-dependent oxidoreductase subunit E [Actinomycetota bacterium]